MQRRNNAMTSPLQLNTTSPEEISSYRHVCTEYPLNNSLRMAQIPAAENGNYAINNIDTLA